MKKCCLCKQAKPIVDFYKDSKSKDGLRYSCKVCGAKAHADNRDHRAVLARNNKLKRVYGITQKDYINMVYKQESKCAICSSNTLEMSGKPLYIDHCHTTGKVRGLLCMNCNTAIGHFKDEIKLLEMAIQYLTQDNL